MNHRVNEGQDLQKALPGVDVQAKVENQGVTITLQQGDKTSTIKVRQEGILDLLQSKSGRSWWGWAKDLSKHVLQLGINSVSVDADQKELKIEDKEIEVKTTSKSIRKVSPQVQAFEKSFVEVRQLSQELTEIHHALKQSHATLLKLEQKVNIQMDEIHQDSMKRMQEEIKELNQKLEKKQDELVAEQTKLDHLRQELLKFNMVECVSRLFNRNYLKTRAEALDNPTIAIGSDQSGISPTIEKSSSK